MDISATARKLAAFYASKLAEHGPTALGMGWGSEAAQKARLEQLLYLFTRTDLGVVVDYGCGYGAMADVLRRKGYSFDYWGYDLSSGAVAAGQTRFDGDDAVHFTTDFGQVPQADYCVASGLFNMRLDIPDEEWHAYILDIVADMWALSRSGIALNLLTSYSDREKQRPELYYADPGRLFDHCKRTLSPHVALLHDYGFWDFTLIVRRESARCSEAPPLQS